MTDPSTFRTRGRTRREVAAGRAAIFAPVAWAILACIEIAGANVGHSLISRPERFFSNSTWHWPVVTAVAVTGILEAAACAGLALRLASRRRWLALAPVPALLGFRLLVAVLLPSDPGGYSVSGAADIAAWLVVVFTPLGVVAAAVAVRRIGGALAWLSAATAVAMVVATVWALAWAARSAPHPQLLAVEPVGGLAALWSAAAGAWLAGWWPAIGSSRSLAGLPAPGRRASVVLALVAVVGVVGASGSFVRSFGPTIVDQLARRTTVERVTADQVERTYRVHRPPTFRGRPGLVILLHGSFGSGFQAETYFGFDAQADRLGWIAVYPDAVADGWDAFGSGPTWGLHPGADDVVFIDQLIHSLEASDGVDPDRVYVAGHSRGGMMTYRLGCELSAEVAAIAPVSGNMATASGSAAVACPITRPVSVLAIHGTADATIPMAGGKVDIVFSPLADVIARWRTLDGCGEASTVAAGGATTTTWACSGGTDVSTRIIDGGCHCWPSDASGLIADFFVAHPRVAPGG